MNPAQAKELLIGNLKRNSYCLNEQTLEDISTHLVINYLQLYLIIQM